MLPGPRARQEGSLVMNKAKLEQDIAELESRLAQAKTARPAHDTSGAHQARILEIEDELTEKRGALDALDRETAQDESGGAGGSERQSE